MMSVFILKETHKMKNSRDVGNFLAMDPPMVLSDKSRYFILKTVDNMAYLYDTHKILLCHYHYTGNNKYKLHTSPSGELMLDLSMGEYKSISYGCGLPVVSANKGVVIHTTTDEYKDLPMPKNNCLECLSMTPRGLHASENYIKIEHPDGLTEFRRKDAGGDLSSRMHVPSFGGFGHAGSDAGCVEATCGRPCVNRHDYIPQI